MATFEQEGTLPKLPLPSLQSTLTQALDSLEPLVTPEDFAKLRDRAGEFDTSETGIALQKHLERSSLNNANYLDSKGIFTATSSVYGALRGQTLPRNPFFILEDDPLKSFAPSQAFRASMLTISALRFAISLRQKNLPPDIAPKSGNALTMQPYLNLFGTTMVPHTENEGSIGIDTKRCPESRHIVIMAHSQFYSLEVLSPDDQIWFSKNELTSRFNEIISDAAAIDPSDATRTAIGTFTTEMKPTWRYARSRLEQTNPEQLAAIDSALFVVCLDHESPQTPAERIQFASHGTSYTNAEGIQIGTCTNRLYDKLCLVVTPNSVAACIYPAAILDGTTVLRFLSDVYTDSVLRLARQINGNQFTLWRETNTVPINEKISKPHPKRLRFDLPSDLLGALHLAETRLADIISQHEYVSRTIDTLGETFIGTRMKLSSDSFIQTCVLVTYHALYGHLPATIEPVTTRRFRNARTEPATGQSVAMYKLCQAFISPTSDEEKWSLFLDAVTEHRQKVNNATHGKGFERHLAALRASFINRKVMNQMHPDLAPIPDAGVPPFLFDSNVDMLFRPELLVANCGNPALYMFGITPAIPAGFGIGYIIKDDSISFVAASQWRQTDRFLNTLDSVFDEVKRVWRSVVTSSAKKNVPKRSEKLQKYIDSIPMSLASSDHATMARPVRKANVDSHLLGGYDYFDVDDMNQRSEMHSRSVSRTNSSLSLEQEVGRKLVLTGKE